MGRSYIFLVMVLAVAGWSGAQAAPLYKWVDEQGRVSYHDQPPPEGSGYRVEKKDLGSRGISGGNEALEQAIKKYPVVLYSVPVCGSCDLARIYLAKRKVPYTEKNLENNPVLQQELKQKTGSLSVPAITIGEKIMNGYVESLLEGELNAAGYPKIGGAAPAAGGDDKDEQDADAPEPEESAQPAEQ